MRKERGSHAQKAMVAAGETAIFALAGMLWPPLYLGMVTTVPASIIETKRAFNELNQRLDKLSARVDDHINSLQAHCGEPIPPNPRIATPEEIKRYKESVLKAASTSPRSQT